jgi:hypothetical protein
MYLLNMLCSSLPLRGGVFLMTRPTVAYLLKKKYGLLNREVDMWSLDTLPPPRKQHPHSSRREDLHPSN